MKAGEEKIDELSCILCGNLKSTFNKGNKGCSGCKLKQNCLHRTLAPKILNAGYAKVEDTINELFDFEKEYTSYTFDLKCKPIIAVDGSFWLDVYKKYKINEVSNNEDNED